MNMVQVRNATYLRVSSGFTLIELLVVISIIGVLSGVILASLGNARTKGSDVTVKSNLNNMRGQAELYYDSNSASYGTFAVATCPVVQTVGSLFNDANIVKAIASASNAAGGSATRCVASPNAYAISVGLKTANTSWCIDSTGQSKSFAGTPTAAITGNACS
jgi:prepilin-type N-terminal cleavage/methylation domain-containing protein